MFAYETIVAASSRKIQLTEVTMSEESGGQFSLSSFPSDSINEDFRTFDAINEFIFLF